MLLWHPLCITNTGVRSAAAFVAQVGALRTPVFAPARFSEIFRIYLFGEKRLTKVNLYKLYKKWILALNFHKMENMVIHIEKWLKMKDCDLYTGLSTLSTSFL